jgi:hypothetical protein
LFALVVILMLHTTLATNGNQQKEISEMNILLPVSLCGTNPTNNPSECRSAKHEISASNGCYTW